HSFTADFVQKGGIDTTIHYRGTVEGDFGKATKWSGSGSAEREGLVEPTGTVQASTTNEVADDSQCAGQPASGQTVLQTDDHVAIVTYDGAVDCDADKSARWSLDGEDQGKITGINCAFGAAGGSAARAPCCWMLIAGVALLAARRRRRSV